MAYKAIQHDCMASNIHIIEQKCIQTFGGMLVLDCEVIFVCLEAQLYTLMSFVIYSKNLKQGFKTTWNAYRILQQLTGLMAKLLVV